MILHATVVHVCACDTESTYDCNIVLASIRGILYNMASNFWIASLNFALITEMGCCLPVGKHSDGSPTFVTNNAKVVNLRAMIWYGWALRASVFFVFLWFAGVHARNHIFKLCQNIMPPTSCSTQTVSLKRYA